jgi:hypothetical protein
MARRNLTTSTMVNVPRILQKFYIYDPNVADTFGGLRVLQDRDDKGNAKDGTNHVLAVTQQVQYWIDQGVMGEKPVGEISESHKKLLAQITRGRSEDNDKDPKRVPRYDRRIQSGAPAFAARPGYPLAKQRRKAKQKDKKKDGNNNKPKQQQRSEPKNLQG